MFHTLITANSIGNNRLLQWATAAAILCKSPYYTEKVSVLNKKTLRRSFWTQTWLIVMCLHFTKLYMVLIHVLTSNQIPRSAIAQNFTSAYIKPNSKRHSYTKLQMFHIHMLTLNQLPRCAITQKLHMAHGGLCAQKFKYFSASLSPNMASKLSRRCWLSRVLSRLEPGLADVFLFLLGIESTSFSAFLPCLQEANTQHKKHKMLHCTYVGKSYFLYCKTFWGDILRFFS